MPAGRGRPLRAADMKKDVRILLVGERESPRAGGWPRPPQLLPPRCPPPPRPRASQLLGSSLRLRPSTSPPRVPPETSLLPGPTIVPPPSRVSINPLTARPLVRPKVLASFPLGILLPGLPVSPGGRFLSSPLVFRGDASVPARQVLEQAGRPAASWNAGKRPPPGKPEGRTGRLWARSGVSALFCARSLPL